MKKIVVVEDDKNILLALSVRLESAGYDVVGASDAVAGTKKAMTEKPDLILLDISMPGGNGFDVAKRIRRVEINTPIIFITANNDDNLIEKANKLDAVDLFFKPYDSEKLLSTISDALN